MISIAGLLISFGLAIAVFAGSYVFHLKKNSPIEEVIEKVAEEVIKDETGLDVDLSSLEQSSDDETKV